MRRVATSQNRCVFPTPARPVIRSRPTPAAVGLGRPSNARASPRPHGPVLTVPYKRSSLVDVVTAVFEVAVLQQR